MTKDVQVTKVIDPIVQSLLFIYFCYTLDDGNYQAALLMILGWQLLSAVVHTFLSFSKKKTIGRIANFIFSVAFLCVYFYMKKSKEVYFEVIGGDGPIQFPVYGMILTTVGIIIAFWYYYICFKEIRSTLKRKKKSSIK